jgi:hypothetical protein
LLSPPLDSSIGYLCLELLVLITAIVEFISLSIRALTYSATLACYYMLKRIMAWALAAFEL